MTTETTPANVDLVTEEPGVRYVDVPLAHHVTWPPRDRLGVDPETVRDYVPGDVLRVTSDDARSLIAAGLAACDPENPDQVRAMLGLDGTLSPEGTTVSYDAGSLPPEWQLAGIEQREGRSLEPDDTWQVAELQQLAAYRQLATSGTKAELLERLGA